MGKIPRNVLGSCLALCATAASLIGNETQFDMTFRTDRVTDRHGQELKGKKIHTYCAGLLLLCALESGRSREEFFPIAEYPAGGKAVANLQQLGITFGADFISPTGALFSPQLEIVGRREPTYDPRREVEEAVFDHFARQLVVKDLKPAPRLSSSSSRCSNYRSRFRSTSTARERHPQPAE